MKVKTAAQSQSCNSPAHAYLGHFRKDKHLNAGHNTVVGATSSIMEKIGRALNTDNGRALKAADKASERASERSESPKPTNPDDKTLRRKALDRAIEGDQ